MNSERDSMTTGPRKSRRTLAINDRMMHRVGFRLREADWRAYQQKVQASGLTPSEFFRHCVLTNRTRIMVSGERRQLLYAVAKIGNNLNQIAHAANTAQLTGKVTELTYLSVLDHLRWIEQFLKELLDRVD